MTVEPEPAQDDPVEAADEEVGQVVGAGIVVRERAGEELVAVGALEPRAARRARPGAAVGVRDDRVGPGGRRVDRSADPLGPVVQLGRQRTHLELPAAPARDRVDVEGERAAGDDHPGHAGNPSWSTNRSLKSVRPESST